MTPKEKAHELVELYCQLLAIRSYENKDKAKHCALICVDEILYTFNTNWQWCSVSMEDKALWSKEFEFWQEVKEEIEKL